LLFGAENDPPNANRIGGRRRGKWTGKGNSGSYSADVDRQENRARAGVFSARDYLVAQLITHRFRLDKIFRRVCIGGRIRTRES